MSAQCALGLEKVYLELQGGDGLAALYLDCLACASDAEVERVARQIGIRRCVAIAEHRGRSWRRFTVEPTIDELRFVDREEIYLRCEKFIAAHVSCPLYPEIRISGHFYPEWLFEFNPPSITTDVVDFAMTVYSTRRWEAAQVHETLDRTARSRCGHLSNLVKGVATAALLAMEPEEWSDVPISLAKTYFNRGRDGSEIPVHRLSGEAVARIEWWWHSHSDAPLWQ